MTLGQFATAIPAPRKWVLNACAVLRLQLTYSVERARILALTRVLEQSFRIPLKSAYRFAAATLRHAPASPQWRLESPDGVVSVVINRDRFLSTFTANLSRALVGYAERRRGRPPRARRRGVAAARDYGVDIGLLRESLKRTPATRLRLLDEDASFLRSLSTRPS